MHEEYPHKSLTGLIIGGAFEVHKHLGHGFLEVVYKDALEIEFKKCGIPFAREVEYAVEYNGITLPHSFFADFIIDEKVILEVKAKSNIGDADYAQTINYLKCSGCPVGLIINFGNTSAEVKRVALTTRNSIV